MKSDKKGFTLVELIVVIAIMAVLAGVVSGATVGILNKKTADVLSKPTCFQGETENPILETRRFSFC